MRYHFIPPRRLKPKGLKTPSADKDMEHLRPSHPSVGSVNHHDHFAKVIQQLLRKLKQCLPSDPAISYLGTYPAETHICLQETCTKCSQLGV